MVEISSLLIRHNTESSSLSAKGFGPYLGVDFPFNIWNALKLNNTLEKCLMGLLYKALKTGGCPMRPSSWYILGKLTEWVVLKW